MLAKLHNHPVNPQDRVWVMADKPYLGEVVATSGDMISVRQVGRKRQIINVDPDGIDMSTGVQRVFWHDPRSINPPKSSSEYARYKRAIAFVSNEMKI